MDEIKPQPGPQETFLATPADIAIYGGAAGGGKALDVATPILTRQGWKPMGELAVGDEVYAPDGQLVFVTHAFEPYYTDDAFRVSFDTGDDLIADGPHQWLTFSELERTQLLRKSAAFKANRKNTRKKRGTGKRPDLSQLNSSRAQMHEAVMPAGTVRTTAQIAQTLYSPRGALNHSIDACAPLSGHAWAEDIDPYLLGVWLGDGHSSAGMLTIAEPEMLDLVRQLEPGTYRQPSQPLGYVIPQLTTRLRRLGLLNRKHVPDWVLLADQDSRLAVLQGLLDSDGTIGSNGKIEFSVVSRDLALGFKSLACTLGIKVSWNESPAKLYGKVCGTRYRLQFRTALPGFRLARKSTRQRRPRDTTRRRYITAVERVPGRWVRCISVGSAQKLFLAGPALIATHNSWALLLEPLRHVTRNPEFGAVFFRRNVTQVKNQGGLWDESMKLYPSAGGQPTSHTLQWSFPGGGSVKFGHLEHEHTVLNWQGSQIPLICFDELTHFTETQVFYMLSRNRSLCGVRPYVRATTNPDADSWVAEFIAWWINQETGFPIPERAGKLRWFIRINDKLLWANSPQELSAKYGAEVMPKSVTFIPASIKDNQRLMEADPGYLANLMALDQVQRERLLDGNWKVRKRVDGMFSKGWLKFTDIRPATLNVYIMVDPASSKRKKSDNTAMVVLGVDAARNKYLLDGFCHKMNLRERWLAFRGLRRKWMAAQGIQGVFCGYERYGMRSDLEYFEEQMELERDFFEIRELNWAQDSEQSKPDRVQRLVPDFIQGRFYLTAAITREVDGLRVPAESAIQQELRSRGEGYRVLLPVKAKDHEHNVYALNAKFLNEYLNFPSPAFPDDFIDACSRIYDMDYQPPLIMDERALEPEVE